MVLQCAGAGEQHLRGQAWCSDGQRQLREGCGAAPASAVQQYLLGRQPPGGVFSSSFDEAHNAGRGASSNLAGLSVEETLAGIWALEDADGALDGGVSLPLASTPVVSDEGSLEIRRDQPLLHQQHLQNYGGNLTATTYPPANEHQRYVRIVGIEEDSFNGGLAVDGSGNGSKAAGSYCSGGALGFGGGDRGGGITGVGQTAAVSPKSSISSDGSGGDMVGNSPSAVWEVDIVHRGAFKGGGGGGSGGGGSGGGGRKRTLDAANEQVLEPWQPQLVSSASDSRASLRDIEQGIDAIKQLFHCANMELESCLTVDEAEIRNRDEKVKQLLQLLRVTSLERDEARDQLQRLLSKMQATPLEQSPDQLHPGLVSAARARCDLDGPRRTHTYPTHGLPYWSESARFSRIVANQGKPDSPNSRANRTDSHRFPCESARLMGIESDHRESDSPDAANLDPTYASSAVDGSPPALPHKVMAVPGYTTVAQQRAPPLPESAAGAMLMPPPPAAEFDPASAVIDCLVLKRALPEKGKLLQAVMDAGPLLQTLLVAGSLPRWRNPPPLQPFQIPPVAVRGRESGILGQNAVLGQNYLVQSSPPAFLNRNSPAAPSPVYLASSPGSSGSGAFVLRGATPASCAGSYQVPAGKRQKF